MFTVAGEQIHLKYSVISFHNFVNVLRNQNHVTLYFSIFYVKNSIRNYQLVAMNDVV